MQYDNWDSFSFVSNQPLVLYVNYVLNFFDSLPYIYYFEPPLVILVRVSTHLFILIKSLSSFTRRALPRSS